MTAHKKINYFDPIGLDDGVFYDKPICVTIICDYIATDRPNIDGMHWLIYDTHKHTYTHISPDNDISEDIAPSDIENMLSSIHFLTVIVDTNTLSQQSYIEGITKKIERENIVASLLITINNENQNPFKNERISGSYNAHSIIKDGKITSAYILIESICKMFSTGIVGVDFADIVTSLKNAGEIFHQRICFGEEGIKIMDALKNFNPKKNINKMLLYSTNSQYFSDLSEINMFFENISSEKTILIMQMYYQNKPNEYIDIVYG